MQLTSGACRSPVLIVALMSGVFCGAAAAQPQVAAGTSVFLEGGGPLNMTVLTPEVAADVPLGESWVVSADWDADIVSGASVAVVDAPAGDVDAIASASVSDVRHVLGGGLKLQDGQSSIGASYHYGFENDYRSHAIDVSARTELYDRNTSFEIGYARSFDRVCDIPDASEPVVKPRMDSSDGCFQDDVERRERELSVHSFQAAYTQAWTPILSSQLTLTAQLLRGFQANPYRGVSVGRVAAQEHHPDDRARYAVGLGVRLWLKPLSGALQPQLRFYRDTWDILSWTAELAYEQSLGRGLRLRGRGRYYWQSGAAFYSDDYVLQPKGQYFTGDRELSPMQSVMLGGQLVWTVPADEEGEVLGFLGGLELVLKGDLIKSTFDEFHYDRATVPNDTALLFALTLLAGF
jgi:hypothetical protein